MNFKEFLNEEFSLNTAATKLGTKLKTDVKVKDGKLLVSYFKDQRSGKFKRASIVELIKSFPWVDKFFDIKDLGGPVRDVGREENPELTDPAIFGTWELTPKDSAPVAYENLENDLDKLPKKALIAIKNLLTNTKELSKILDKLIASKHK